jgi:hypothetical protein
LPGQLWFSLAGNRSGHAGHGSPPLDVHRDRLAV